MESTKELRQKLQSMKVDNRERPWGYRLLQRGPSIYLTRILLKTNISANQVTIIDLILGFAGSLILLASHPAAIPVGLFVLYLNILFDKIDGEIARYRKVFSLRGIYLDELNHLLVPPLFFACLTIAVAPNAIILILGMIAAISMPIIRIGHSIAPQIFAKKYMKRPEDFHLPEAGSDSKIDTVKKSRSLLRMPLQLIHQFQEFFMILLVFFIASIIQIFVTIPALYPLLILIFGFLLPLIVIENSAKGYFAIEHRIAHFKTKDRLSSTN